MIKIFWLFLIIAFLPLGSFAETPDDSLDCSAKMIKELRLNDKISVLKKDQQTISGYLQDYAGATLVVNTKNYHDPLIEIKLDEIDRISYQHLDLAAKKSNRETFFGIGALAGFAVSLTIEILNYTDDDIFKKKSFRPMVIIGATAGGGLLMMLLGSSGDYYQDKTETIDCSN